MAKNVVISSIPISFFMPFHYTIPRRKFFVGSTALAVTTALSYLFGLIRDRQFAHVFGASHLLDAYNAAFLVPDLILNIFVAGALTAAFIPLFTEASPEERPEFVNSVLNSSLLVVTAVGILVFIFATPLSHLVVRGLDPSSQHVYVNLLRMLLLSPLVFAISNTLGSILASHERFFWYGMSAVFYNLGTILGILFLAPKFGIYGAAIGTLVGALLHLLPRFLHSRRDFSYSPKVIVTTRLRTFARLMLPKMIGQPVEQFMFLGFTVIASSLGAGSIAVMNFAHNFQAMPISVVGITMALTAFPALSRAAVGGVRRTFVREFWFTAGAIAAISTAAAIVLYVIRRPLIAILLGGGKFETSAISLTVATLAIFLFSVPLESIVQLLARSFYSLKDSLTPTIINVLGLIGALIGAYVFSKTMGVPGIAVGFLVGSVIKIILLSLFLSVRIRSRLS